MYFMVKIIKCILSVIRFGVLLVISYFPSKTLHGYG